MTQNGKQVTKFGMDRKIEVTPEQMKTIKSVIFPQATDEELKFFVYYCIELGVHPLSKLVHPVMRFATEGDKSERRVSFQTSIDLFRALRESAGDYAGMEEPEYGPETKELYPEWAKVTIYRWMPIPGKDEFQSVAFTATARWKEYYPGEKLGFMWRKMPYNQLAKCAEALATRKGWPKRLHDTYVHEEMAQAKMIDASPGAEDGKSLTDSVKPKEKQTETQKPAETKKGLGGVKKEVKAAAPEGGELFHPATCTKDPMKCNESSFVDDIALCSDGQHCAFGQGASS